MKKLLILLVLFSACSGKLPPEEEVQKIFARHSFQEHSPESIAAALKDGGMAGLARLDPRAALLNGKKPLKARPSDRNYSSGLLLRERAGRLELAGVFPGSSAEAAGLKAGDEVLALNGAAATAASAQEAFGRSTRLALRASRSGSAFDAELDRDRYFFPQVFAFCDRPSRTCFLRLGLFYEGSSAAAVEALGAAAAAGAERVVIDVRDNPGGVPAEAAEVLKAFAPKAGPVFEMRSRHPGYALSYSAAGRGRFAGLRAAVLVNGGTSMAAEVFARAMKDLAGAPLVGRPTAASVSFTRAFALRDGRGLEITVARMYPPSGLDLESSGVAPDSVSGGEGRVWDDSRETALLGDAAWAKALELLAAQ